MKKKNSSRVRKLLIFVFPSSNQIYVIARSDWSRVHFKVNREIIFTTTFSTENAKNEETQETTNSCHANLHVRKTKKVVDDVVTVIAKSLSRIRTDANWNNKRTSAKNNSASGEPDSLAESDNIIDRGGREGLKCQTRAGPESDKVVPVVGTRPRPRLASYRSWADN